MEQSKKVRFICRLKFVEFLIMLRALHDQLFPLKGYIKNKLVSNPEENSV